jgi:hypothetical protein
MDFLFRKTNELSDEQIEQVCALFSSVFMPDRTPAMFKRQFLGTPLGYSYHGLMLDGTRIVGSYSAVPYRYVFDGRDLLFALAVDTQIAKEYRGDPWRFVRMANPVYDAARADGIPFAFCFPNENIYLVRKKIMEWRDIGTLAYYVLPIAVGAKWPALRFLDPALRAAINAFTWEGTSARRLESEKARSFVVEKRMDAAFTQYRYSFWHRYSDHGTGYTRMDTPCGHLVYRREAFEGVKVAFLVDVFPLTAHHLKYAVRRVFMQEKHRASAIVYIGHLPFRPSSLFGLPERLEPRKIHMTGKVLIDGVVDERVFDIRNWCVNLSNYDAI